jgi:hypothetical protein
MQGAIRLSDDCRAGQETPAKKRAYHLDVDGYAFSCAEWAVSAECQRWSPEKLEGGRERAIVELKYSNTV